MQKIGQFDPRKEDRSRDTGDVTPEMAKILHSQAEETFRRISAVVTGSSIDRPLPPQIPAALAHLVVPEYN